jgi:von Willebrand factor type D domain
VSGDPHFVTSDGLRHSCQAQGDFVLLKAPSGLQIQAQFTKKSDLVSLVTGIAMRGDSSAHTIADVVATDAEGNEGKPTTLLVDGTRRNNTNYYEDDYYRVRITGNRHDLTMKATNVTVRAEFWNPGFRHLDVHVVLPQTFINATPNACGLLGSPDNRPSNDWMASDCTQILGTPTSNDELFNREGYEYCTSTWCIRNASSSLFTYNNATFDAFSACDAPYPGPVDVGLASLQLQALCGIDIPCLMDGIEIGMAGAQRLLDSESRVGRRSVLQANPATIQVQSTFNVEITIDLSHLANLPGNLESFQLFRVDSETRQVGSVPVVTLLDVGSGFGRDSAANDGIFSNVLAIRSDVSGEMFGLRAVPVFDGLPDPASSLAFESLNTVRSYSPASGIGENTTLGGNETTGTLTVSNVSELAVFIEYTWPQDQSDLDTGTTFLNQTVGFCAMEFSPYMTCKVTTPAQVERKVWRFALAMRSPMPSGQEAQRSS